MKVLIVLVFVCASVLSCVAAGMTTRADIKKNIGGVPATVTSLNASQYIGLWYQMYQDAFDDLFEAGAYCATAEYHLLPNGSVSVHNIQRLDGYDGRRESVRGYAYQPNPKEYPGRLEVQFPFNAFPAPYWIFKLGPVVNDQYQWSFVSDYDLASLFILARNYTEFEMKYKDEVLTFAASMGFTGIFNSPQALPQGPKCTYG